MPAPTVQCVICGETVLKARTRHIGDGQRACKTHQGVIETATQVHDDRLMQIRQRSEEEKNRRRKHHEARKHAFDLQMRCHVCNHPVVHVSDLLMELVIAEKTRQMKGDNSANLIFNPAPLIEDVKAAKGDVIGCFVYTKEELSNEQWRFVCKAVRQELQMGIEMFGFTCVCVECMRRLGLPNKLDNLPKLSFDQLVNFSAIMEPMIEEIVLERQGSND